MIPRSSLTENKGVDSRVIFTAAIQNKILNTVFSETQKKSMTYIIAPGVRVLKVMSGANTLVYPLTITDRKNPKSIRLPTDRMEVDGGK